MGVEVDVEWLPFFLNANLPKEGVDKLEHYKKKFGGACGARWFVLLWCPVEHDSRQRRTRTCAHLLAHAAHRVAQMLPQMIATGKRDGINFSVRDVCALAHCAVRDWCCVVS